MLKYILFFLCAFCFSLSFATNPVVPADYEFAGIKLTIDQHARKEIQKDVDALLRNQTYFDRKVEKVDLYFPIIERVFAEEGLPDDFKYLTIQESALTADAVSSSNAVGFWQFKEGTAKEVGLRVDREIDERMHITASSRGAAKYLKKNNFFFDNWVYALMAYNTGPGGAEQHIDKKYLGKSKMEIDRRTHWYVKKFLAYKIAFENAVNKNKSPEMVLYEYDKTNNKSLAEIADFFEIDRNTVEEYNKWLRRGRIPSDKVYLAIIPVGKNDLVAQNLLGPVTETEYATATKPKFFSQNTYKPIAEFDFTENQTYPEISEGTKTKIKVNRIPGFIAGVSDNIRSVTTEYGISQEKFRKYNDMTASDEIRGGQVYYLKAKKSKARIHYHTVLPGETAWSISQKYGLKLKSLLTKNRMREEKALSPNMILWLRFIRPANQPVEFRNPSAKNVVVKSYSNQIAYPAKENSTSGDKKSIAQITNEPNNEDKDAADNDFLFEELDDNSVFISENSYINPKNNSPEVQAEIVPVIKNTTTKQESKSVNKKEIYHIVKQGETLFSISRKYSVTIGELRQWNNIDDLDVLNVGQSIVVQVNQEIPKPEKAQNTSISTKTYTVKQEDTLYGIARKYNISVKELMDLNGKSDFIIKNGEILIIPQQN